MKDKPEDKKAHLRALIDKFSEKVDLSERGPLHYNKDLEDPDYYYAWPLAEDQLSWEAIGYEVVTDLEGQIGDSSISKPAQMGSATEVRYRSAHHILMRTPMELHLKRRAREKTKNLALDARLKVNPDKRLTTKYTKTPE